MKLLDWISGKPKKDQQEQNANADSSQKHSKNSVLRAAAAVQVKLQQNKKNRLDMGLYEEEEEEVKKRHEIVKIFVNHEEYGLLAIGTLGLYDLTSGVEPEIELFEVKPNAVVNQESSSVYAHKEEDESHSKSDKAVAVRKQDGSNVKKLFLDLSRSKLADRLLHPLSYLNPGSIRKSFHDYMSPCSYPSQKTTGNEASLFRKLLLSKGNGLTKSSSIKRITCDRKKNEDIDGSRTKKEEIDGSCSPARKNRKRRSKLKKAMTQFSCMGIAEEDSEYDADNDDSNSLNKPEYWIRTDSDYVVLEM